jgi:isopenicillin N synthase-like dioxygenase
MLGTLWDVSPPVIDIAPLRASPVPPSEIVAAIDAACTEIGFFVVTGHGVESQVAEVFHAAGDLFALSEDTKEVVAMVDRQGFVPARHRVLDNALHSAPMEYFDVGMRGAGRWPSEVDLPEFREVVARYQHTVRASSSRSASPPADT